MKIKSFLKWIGGKYDSLDHILPFFPTGNRLIEPFTGSGTIFLNSNYLNYLLADSNSDLINLHHYIQLEGETFIKRLCDEHPQWPCQDTLFTWIRQYPEFSEQYKRAKICQVDILVDDLIDIADDSAQDMIVDEQGKNLYDAERVARSKLRIETRKWIAARLVPRVYGNNGDEIYTSDAEIKEELKQLRANLDKQFRKDY